MKSNQENTSEFHLSILDHAVASGRDANCFFQSFFHILTHQTPETLAAIKLNYPDSIQALVDAFNHELLLDPPVYFERIIEISKSLHPLERECVFGPILRHTYNLMIDRLILTGAKLEYHPHAIVSPPQTESFSNAFGAKIIAFMSEEQFNLLKMPAEVAERIQETKFKIGDRVFYFDSSPTQKIKNGEMFSITLIYADTHLNYTLGTRALNKQERDQVETKRTDTKDGIFAIAAAKGTNAPLAEPGLRFSAIADGLCERFSLKRKIVESGIESKSRPGF